MTELYIKNMVCARCILVVESELVKLGFHPLKVDLGYAQMQEDSLDEQKSALLSGRLQELGFELLDDSRMRLIEKMKNIVIRRIHHTEELNTKVNWSALVADEMHQDYSSLSSLFSSVEGITFEQYVIRQKIEKAKELLFYDELNLSEISYRLGYSSVQHLSSQFKRITGQTPSEFRLSRASGAARKPIDLVG